MGGTKFLRILVTKIRLESTGKNAWGDCRLFKFSITSNAFEVKRIPKNGNHEHMESLLSEVM